jgi:hypothetical protein
MARTRRPYPPECRERLVALVRAGRTPEELAKEFEPKAQTIRNWVGQAATDRGERPQVVTDVGRAHSDAHPRFRGCCLTKCASAAGDPPASHTTPAPPHFNSPAARPPSRERPSAAGPG